MMRRFITTSLLVAAWTVALLMAGEARASDDDGRIAKIKAAYIVNFLKYVTWPAEAFADDDAPLLVMVVGNDGVGPVLDTTLQNIEGIERPVRVTREMPPARNAYKKQADYAAAMEAFLDRLRQSHVLFIGDAESFTPHLITAASSHPVLTISDGQELAGAGFMLSLVLDHGRIVFHANPKAIDRTRLKISSKLLRLARNQ